MSEINTDQAPAGSKPDARYTDPAGWLSFIGDGYIEVDGEIPLYLTPDQLEGLKQLLRKAADRAPADVQSVITPQALAHFVWQAIQSGNDASPMIEQHVASIRAKDKATIAKLREALHHAAYYVPANLFSLNKQIDELFEQTLTKTAPNEEQ